MNLLVMLPNRVLLETPVAKVNAEGANGAFGILPRHVDYATELAPGLLSFETPDGDERFVAMDGGILVKLGDQVMVSTHKAVVGSDLGSLRQRLEGEFAHTNEAERRVRTALAQLEIDLARRISELSDRRAMP